MSMHRGWVVLLIAAGLCRHVFAEPLNVKNLPEQYQSQIVQFYSDGRCDKVRNLVSKIDPYRLRPNVLAIVAFCEPPGRDAEALFAQAEAESPTGDLIAVLHALYRSKRSASSAEPLWQHVLIIARNAYFRNMAKEHLAGVADKEDDEEPLDLSSTTGFAQIFLGGNHQTNAQPAEFFYQPRVSSFGVTSHLDATARHWYEFGSVALHYTTGYNRILSAPQYNLWENNLDAPISVHITSNKDIIFRPITSYLRVGTDALRLAYGIGVAGAVYRETYEQSVQGIVYSDRIFVPELSPEQGAHYRFQYQWDAYPKAWFLSSLLAVEHVSAGNASILFGQPGNFQMSHTDLSVDFKVEKSLPRFTLGFIPRLRFRLDSQDSTYGNNANTSTIVKRRQDTDIGLQWNITVPLLPSLHLFAWYEWHAVYSNIGPADYIDRNYRDQTVGVGVKTTLSTY